MKKLTTLVVSMVVAVTLCTSPIFAAGGKNQGDVGSGSVDQGDTGSATGNAQGDDAQDKQA